MIDGPEYFIYSNNFFSIGAGVGTDLSEFYSFVNMKLITRVASYALVCHVFQHLNTLHLSHISYVSHDFQNKLLFSPKWN
jgi:hypothetical protein